MSLKKINSAKAQKPLDLKSSTWKQIVNKTINIMSFVQNLELLSHKPHSKAQTILLHTTYVNADRLFLPSRFIFFPLLLLANLNSLFYSLKSKRPNWPKTPITDRFWGNKPKLTQTKQICKPWIHFFFMEIILLYVF